MDWDKVKKSRMTLTKWMDDFVKYNAELSESSMKTKRNTHARIDQYLVNYFGSSLAKAVRDGLIEQNPFLLLEAKEKPQKRVAEREFLTIEEIKKVMKHHTAKDNFYNNKRPHMSNGMLTPVQKRESYYVSSGAARPLGDAAPLGVFHVFNSNTSSKRIL